MVWPPAFLAAIDQTIESINHKNWSFDYLLMNFLAISAAEAAFEA
jgi:hypothetical protein